ncbi:MobF family relaxase [Actinokineospora iranica]|uniref:Conjugative relaxase domain-containing protein, TrwC/TraI family n=1 Tax=Actinokineospora iranica TaxID=1271860 RepID=A0A1G6VS47_9PSEU|nr:MobF family relaxase [Actinokineospora iranica]SDD56243.1 conjugative relaxase domain-containing protein, TrwC/TraI family [Actinokineospora iranica]
MEERCTVITVRKLTPGGYEYLTGSVACADRELEPGESLADYYFGHGYPPGEWLGRGAAELGVHGQVSAAQIQALFGEGRHPDADRIQAELIAAGHSEKEALEATRLGRRFYQYNALDQLRSDVIAAYKQHNLDNGRPPGAPIDDDTRAGLRREVQERAYADAHEGRAPSGEELTAWLAEQKRALKSATSGYELVIAPTKGFSLLMALGDKPARELATSIHRQAVRDTVSYLEDNVAYTRRGDGGYTQHDTRGITAAAFDHWDSRAGDPHLHTHVLISAKVQGPDGKWTAIDGRTIYAATVTMSEFYNSRVRDLAREHGASWTERPHEGIDLKRPVWELDGVPDDLLAGFSRRASQVEQERARQIARFRREHGHEPSPKEVLEISRRAQYATRSAKQPPRTFVEHLRRWRGEAEKMVDPAMVAELGRRVFGAEPEPVAELDIPALAEATVAVVSDHYAHFNRWHLEAEAHRQTAHLRVAPGARDAVIGDVVGAVLASEDLIALTPPSLVDEPAALRRRSGESVFVEHNSGRYTTDRTLREESALAGWGQLGDGRKLQPATVNRVLGEAPRLSFRQRAAVMTFALSGRRVQLLYAPAGTGKTSSMRVYAEAVRAEGGRVFAFGPSARAAHELATAIDARPHTLHQVTTAQAIGVVEKAFPFRRGDVLIIDEISMAGTHTLYDVVRYALQRGADVRLVGDDRQLSAVEAGGAIRWFAHLNGALRLRQVVRFHDREQGAASLLLHESNPAGLDYYFDRGWVSEGSRETIRDAAHRAWRADLDGGRQSLLIVAANADVTALNHEARALRISRGDVDDGVTVQLHDGTIAGRGDWVVTRHNDRLRTVFGGKDFVKNGDTWTVLAVRGDGALKLRHHEHKGTLVLPADYVAEDVELAYASTINRVQGMTSLGSAHAIATKGIFREQLYTLLTRAVHDNRIYVETVEHTIDSHQETPLERTARGMLEQALARSSAETSANEELEAGLVAAESLNTLVGRHDYVATLGAEEVVEAVLTDLVPELLDQPAAPALRQTVRTAEALGWDAAHLVASALAGRPLDTTNADDPAAVLQWRIEQQVLTGTPPPRAAAPTLAAVNRWRTLIDNVFPAAAVEEPSWEQVWRLGAAAASEGLDVDSAVTQAATWLARRPSNDPVTDHDAALEAVRTALQAQRDSGGGWQPAVPWLARPRPDLADQPELVDFLRRSNAAIATRVQELRTTTAVEEPAWTARLGPRPVDDAAAAVRWDTAVGLAAAYRDTYNITSDAPWYPLGDKPSGIGQQAQAWTALMRQWAAGFADEPDSDDRVEAVSERGLLDGVNQDELLAALIDDAPAQGADESLADLARRYHRAVRHADEQHIDAHITRVLTERAPSALGQNAEPALRWLLHRAHNQGWPVEQVVPDQDSLATLAGARDPAALLYRRVEARIHRAAPPQEPEALDGPLPWLPAALPGALDHQPDLAQHLADLAHAITEQAARLREEIVISPPAWAAGLGPRPTNAVAAARWTDLAAAAAAYRATFDITTDSPDAPLGVRPPDDGPRARAWKTITDQWRPVMTTADDKYAANQDLINRLREKVRTSAEDRVEDAEALADHYRAEADDLRSDLNTTREAHLDDALHDIEEQRDLGSSLGH